MDEMTVEELRRILQEVPFPTGTEVKVHDVDNVADFSITDSGSAAVVSVTTGDGGELLLNVEGIPAPA